MYLYADEDLIAEATQNIKLNADNSITATTSPTISSQYGIKPDNPFGAGVLFIKTKDKNQQETFAYYQHDKLGMPIQAIDKAGKVVWAADYNAFGQATISANDITSNLRLPGQCFDAETKLHYNWNRYYSPETGRYITSDPIGLAGGINRYAYVLGNPTGLVYFLGLECDNVDTSDQPENILGVTSANIPAPGDIPRNIPGGPYTPAVGQKAGDFFGPPNPEGGPRQMLRYVPDKNNGGPKTADKPYYKIQQKNGKWTRYSSEDGREITEDEAHPKPLSPENESKLPEAEAGAETVGASIAARALLAIGLLTHSENAY